MLLHRKVAALGVAFLGPILANCGSGGLPNNERSGRDSSGVNNGTPVQPAPAPDDPVSFANDIQPIFDARCTRCHNPILHTGMMDLTAAVSYANLVNVPTSPACQQQVPNSVRVVPFDTMGSMLWLKTKPDPGRCANPMPQGTPGLDVICHYDFSFLDAWIAQGAQNN